MLTAGPAAFPGIVLVIPGSVTGTGAFNVTILVVIALRGSATLITRVIGVF
jgi:hypothetical protein